MDLATVMRGKLATTTCTLARLIARRKAEHEDQHMKELFGVIPHERYRDKGGYGTGLILRVNIIYHIVVGDAGCDLPHIQAMGYHNLGGGGGSRVMHPRRLAPLSRLSGRATRSGYISRISVTMR